MSFVKCGKGKDAPWVFFDSMADRMGKENNYKYFLLVLFKLVKINVGDSYNVNCQNPGICVDNFNDADSI